MWRALAPIAPSPSASTGRRACTSCASTTLPRRRGSSFVARPRSCLVLATNTWNAYNDFGGRNLYSGASTVSFERPLAPGMLEKDDTTPGSSSAGTRVSTRAQQLSTWHGMAGWAGQERRFANWAARRGIELDFATNRDLETIHDCSTATACTSASGTTSTGPGRMRDTVERFVAAGGNAAFFSGNTCYWQVRITTRSHDLLQAPVRRRSLVRASTTPASPRCGRIRWCRGPRTSSPACRSRGGGYHRIFRSVPRGAGGYEVHRPDHWLLDGTDLRRRRPPRRRVRRRRLRVRRVRLHVPQRTADAHWCGRHAAGLRGRRDRAGDTVRPRHHAAAARAGWRVRAGVPRPPVAR